MPRSVNVRSIIGWHAASFHTLNSEAALSVSCHRMLRNSSWIVASAKRWKGRAFARPNQTHDMIKNNVASKNAGPSLPNSESVQEALIGALLQNGNALIDEFSPARIASAITSGGLSPIFHAIAHLYDERSPIGLETVIDVLRREGKLEAVGGESSVRKLWVDGNGDRDIFGYYLKQSVETNAQYDFARQVSHFHSQVINGEITIGSAPPVIEKITKTCQHKEASGLVLCAVKEISTLSVPKGAKLLEDNLLSKTAELVLAGMMGLGKSRLLFQLALACAAGRGWCGFETFAKGLRWLLLQTENNNERLKTDIEPMLNIFGRDSACCRAEHH